MEAVVHPRVSEVAWNKLSHLAGAVRRGEVLRANSRGISQWVDNLFATCEPVDLRPAWVKEAEENDLILASVGASNVRYWCYGGGVRRVRRVMLTEDGVEGALKWGLELDIVPQRVGLGGIVGVCLQGVGMGIIGLAGEGEWPEPQGVNFHRRELLAKKYLKEDDLRVSKMADRYYNYVPPTVEKGEGESHGIN